MPMPVTYRQIAHRIRVQRGPGNPDLVNERPREKSGARRFLDSDASPTLVTFDELAEHAVAGLLAGGAIVPYTAPAVASAEDAPAELQPETKPARRRKGEADGEAAG